MFHLTNSSRKVLTFLAAAVFYSFFFWPEVLFAQKQKPEIQYFP